LSSAYHLPKKITSFCLVFTFDRPSSSVSSHNWELFQQLAFYHFLHHFPRIFQFCERCHALCGFVLIRLCSTASTSSLACMKPKDLGHLYELRTQRLLAQHIHDDWRHRFYDLSDTCGIAPRSIKGVMIMSPDAAHERIEDQAGHGCLCVRRCT